jgi:arginine utilization protein RocB
MYYNDTTKYVYTGAVGKVLPCFYIQGKETHVGQCFEGVDASLIAAELVKKINLNPEFCEQYNGEYTLPPSVLKMKDLKPEYNVQTSFSSFVYFNYFIHNDSTIQIMSKLKNAAYESLEAVENIIDERYREFCDLTNMNYTRLTYEKQILSYDELLDISAKKYKGDLNQLIEKLTEELIEKNTDKREISLEIVKKLCLIASIKKTTIIIFFAAPYCPHNTLKNEVEEERNLYDNLDNLINEFSNESKEKFKICQFFPSLSDSSYLKIDDDYDSIGKLINNFPMYKKLYKVPLEKIKAFNIPGINYGCYGKDCHKWTERLYIPYSFEILPKLILKTLDYFLE